MRETRDNVWRESLGHGECSFAFIVRNSAAELVKEDEPLNVPVDRNGFARGRVGEVSELSLMPGDAINESADLSTLFALSPGDCTAQVSMTGKSTTVLLPPAISQHTDVEMPKSNILNLVEVPKPPRG